MFPVDFLTNNELPYMDIHFNTVSKMLTNVSRIIQYPDREIEITPLYNLYNPEEFQILNIFGQIILERMTCPYEFPNFKI